MFGGCSAPNTDFECTAANDLWAYLSETGERVERRPATAPPALETLAYDSASDRMILFGGNETWTYDRTTNGWTNETTLPSPSLRSGHAMVYATLVDRIVLFGGFGAQPLRDTWLYAYP